MKNYLRFIEDNKENIIDFLARLIRTPSLSGKENEVADLIQDEMEELGYTVSRDEMGNIIAFIGADEKKTILFDAHMDHVDPGDTSRWRYPPYKAVIDDNVMFGRGTVDMKGALAAMVYGCADQDLAGRVMLTCVTHEETNEGVATEKILNDADQMPDACILGEPTDLKLSIGQRGRAVFRVTTNGATSHASMPELGENAIYLMNPIISEIKHLNENLSSDPFLGKGSIAVTEIRSQPRGGPIIPDKCELLVDRRTIPGEGLQELLEQIKDKAKGATVELLEDEITFYTGYKAKIEQYFPGWVTDENNWVVVNGKNAIEEAIGIEPELFGWRFSTNGVATAAVFGIPTIGFGPGDPSLAHQPNEHIDLDDLISASKGYSRLAHTLIK